MKTPEQKLELAKKMWEGIQRHEEDLGAYGKEFGLNRTQMNRLYILRLCNAEDSFNQAIESLL